MAETPGQEVQMIGSREGGTIVVLLSGFEDFGKVLFEVERNQRVK